jgi:hypothetical protein
MPRKPRNSIRLSTPPEPIRFDLTFRNLRERLSRYEKEAANFRRGQFTESETQRYLAELRRLLEAAIRHAEEVVKLGPQLKRPN